MKVRTEIKIDPQDEITFCPQWYGAGSHVSVFSALRADEEGFDIDIPYTQLDRWIIELSRAKACIDREIAVRKAVDDGGATDLPRVPGDAEA